MQYALLTPSRSMDESSMNSRPASLGGREGLTALSRRFGFPLIQGECNGSHRGQPGSATMKRLAETVPGTFSASGICVLSYSR